jgi:hypothetical protein
LASLVQQQQCRGPEVPAIICRDREPHPSICDLVHLEPAVYVTAEVAHAVGFQPANQVCRFLWRRQRIVTRHDATSLAAAGIVPRVEGVIASRLKDIGSLLCEQQVIYYYGAIVGFGREILAVFSVPPTLRVPDYRNRFVGVEKGGIARYLLHVDFNEPHPYESFCRFGQKGYGGASLFPVALWFPFGKNAKQEGLLRGTEQETLLRLAQLSP